MIISRVRRWLPRNPILPSMQRLACAMVIGLLAAEPAAAADSASSTFQIDPAHDGVVTFAARFAPPLKKLWSIDFGGAVSYPVVAGNLVLVLADSAIGTQLAALDSGSGKPVWQKLVNGDVMNSHLAYDAGTVFLMTQGGPLQAFSAATGKPLWATKLPQELFFDDVPVVSDGLVFVAGEGTGGYVYALDEHSGLLVWDHLLGGLFNSGGNSVLTLGGGHLYAPFIYNVEAFAPVSGAVLWNYCGCGDGGGVGFAAYYKGLLYAPAINVSSGVVLTTTTPRVLSVFGKSFPTFSGSNYFTMANTALTASNIDVGTLSWFFPITESVSLPSITVNGNVYTLSDTGNLYINSGGSGVLLQTVNVGLGRAGKPNAAPASGMGAGDGKIFVPSGSIFAAFAPK
jgi:outer membrane protein assembly factor BamB